MIRKFNRLFVLFSGLAILISVAPGVAQAASFTMPKTVTAGQAFSIPTTGSGPATFYIVGLGQTLEQKVNLGQAVFFPNGTLTNAGLYLAILAGNSSRQSEQFHVVPGSEPAQLSFLALPSRLPVGLRNAITGTAYVYDAYFNLITTPDKVSFTLTTPSGAVQSASVATREGAAWTAMNSTAKEGDDTFVARAGGISSQRIVQQVPGTACNLTITAQQQPNGRLLVKTNPVQDCNGNPVPDGTIISFTERYGDEQATADVPLKKGIAQVELPAHRGAVLTAASGVALGNEIRWER